jgi:hypothetical protein
MTMVSSKAKEGESIELANNSHLLIRLDVVNQSRSITFASLNMLVDLHQLLHTRCCTKWGVFPRRAVSFIGPQMM